MAGSSIGTLFKVTTWGESHGPALGAVIDGCPAGLALSEGQIQPYMDRRKPGQGAYATRRREGDTVRILSGVFEGKSTGAPILLSAENTSQRSQDYSRIASVYRPGHADYTFEEKYGFRDYRGGGRSSGRETLCRVAAGAVAALFLKELGITFLTFTRALGPYTLEEEALDEALIGHTPTGIPNQALNARAEGFLRQCMAHKDSAGGVAECRVYGLPAGLGDPVFEKLDANLAKALVSIGAVKAFEIGEGVNAARLTGSANNDAFIREEGRIRKATNHSGGTLGGISDGSPLVIRAHIKPTPSIFSPQQTVTRNGEEATIEIQGRHDPVIVPRALAVVEAMAAITLADALLMNMGARLDSVRKFYRG